MNTLQLVSVYTHWNFAKIFLWALGKHNNYMYLLQENRNINWKVWGPYISQIQRD